VLRGALRGDRSGDPASRRASIARNTVYAGAVQLTTATFTAALTIFLARSLDPDAFGTFALALSIGGVLLVPSDLGITHATSRFVAERRGDESAVAHVVRTALGLKIAASLVVSGALVALAAPIATAYGSEALARPLRAIAAAVFAQSVFVFFGAILVAQAHIAGNWRLVLSESAFEATASIALVLLGGGAAGAAFGRAMGYTAGAILGALVVAAQLGRGVFRVWKPERRLAGTIAGYAGALAVVDAAFTVFAFMNGLVIAAYLGTAAVGIYAAASRLVTVMQHPGLALAASVGPRVARNPNEPQNVDALSHALRYLTILQAWLVAPIVVWADPIVNVIYGADYARSANVLRAFAPYVFLVGVATLVSVAVNYLGYARQRVPIAIGIVAVNLALLAFLLPTLGVPGAALALGLSYCLYTPAHVAICRRAIGLRIAPLIATAVRAAAAAVAMGGVLALFGTRELAPGELVGGLVLGTLAYVIVLLVTREPAVADARAALRRLRMRPA
jgi:O-antigen/teichoic acid export membrane protein